MGNSTMSLNQAYDTVVSEGIFDPRQAPSGYNEAKALEVGNTVMADMICERFNWKFNRFTAAPFLSNSWQQDYPQPAQKQGIIGWGEDADIIDINNTVIPKPLWNLTIRRGLSRTNVNVWRPRQLCWMYNKDLSWGAWPGPDVVFSPLLGINAPVAQNPIMNFIDANGNYLILTTFGTTGSTAPSAPANSAEGTTVNDGSVVWTVVDGDSQGWRFDALPSSTGPTYQTIPYCQLEPPLFADLAQMLDPIPDSYRRHFLEGLRAACLKASPILDNQKRGEEARQYWFKSMADAMKQGDREMNAYGLMPQTSVVQGRWDGVGPFTADRPY